MRHRRKFEPEFTAKVEPELLPRAFVSRAVLVDVFTRAVRGWELARALTEALPRAALACEAMHLGGRPTGLDAGSQPGYDAPITDNERGPAGGK